MASTKRDNTTQSCSVCQQRKVKCNRVYPCAACLKSGLDCAFPEGPRKRPRRKQILDDGSSVGNPSGETAVTSQSIRNPSALPLPAWTPSVSLEGDGASAAARTNATPRPVSSRQVRLRNAQFSPRQDDTAGAKSTGIQIDDHRPARAANEILHRREVSDQATEQPEHSTETYFPFHQVRDAHNKFPHLQAHHIIALWQAYIQNVDPLTKLVHVPSIQQLVLSQVGQSALTLNEAALVAAIHFVSTVSLDDKECRSSLQESRDLSIRRQRIAVEDALSSASFMISSDVLVIQALALYLTALQSLGETETVWSMMGMAFRIASAAGIPHDIELPRITPFEAEMRRRLWWVLIGLDSHANRLLGRKANRGIYQLDSVQQPADLNDTELFPSMKRLPEPRSGLTDAVVRIRAAGSYHLPYIHDSEEIGDAREVRKMSFADNEKIIDKMEQKMHESVFTFCDSSVPLQLLTLLAGTMFISKARLMIQAAFNPASTPTTPSPRLYELSLETSRLQIMLWTEPSLRRWRWHWGDHFSWFALAYIVHEARLRPASPEAREVFDMLRTFFDVVVQDLRLEPEKRILTDEISNLLIAATNPQRGQISIVQQEDLGVSHGTRSGPDSGSRPHNALLPGMMDTPSHRAQISDGDVRPENSRVPDLGPIDWVEIDDLFARLL